MDIKNSTDICPYCGYNDNQSYKYEVFGKQYKTNVCRSCSKMATYEINKEEKAHDKRTIPVSYRGLFRPPKGVTQDEETLLCHRN